ncbi:MAG: DUF2920 family protein [Lachnospiraceae bacterium]|nr:DUF2920 family protein [Lachnospiraceae bacterium]
MAREYTLDIQGQPTRYSDKVRRIRMYFAEPEAEAEECNGILLLIAGYGGHGMSRVYQKMRQVFADQNHFFTVQCDYLGYQYMQNDHHLTVTEDMLRKVLSPREFHSLRRDYDAHRHLLSDKVLSDYIDLEESAEDFNEMGLGQAMDNLMAVKVLLDILQENGLEYNRKRVYLYGQSHGAYLGYLCNVLAPGLFTGMIDNSAYLLPYYLEHDREVTKVGDTVTLQKWYHYLIADQDWDVGSYDLRALYAGYHGQAQIVVYHGEEDTMIPIGEKKAFLEKLPRVSLHVVTKEMVDGVVFRSAGHSLGADLLKVFERAVEELDGARPIMGEPTGDHRPENMAGEQQAFHNYSFQTARYQYEIDWKSGVPVLYRMER